MVFGKLPPRKIAPRSGLGFGLGLALELGLGAGEQFSSGSIILEPKTIHVPLCTFVDFAFQS